jgi:hypothetical protein
LRQVCTRMGRVLPHLTQFDVSIYNYKLRDPTSVIPYVARTENMDLRWPVCTSRVCSSPPLTDTGVQRPW